MAKRRGGRGRGRGRGRHQWRHHQSQRQHYYYHHQQQGRKRYSKTTASLQFTEHSLQKHLDDLELNHKLKEKQKEYVKKIDVLEQELLSRTVIITCVKDLRKKENLNLLKSFCTTMYGPVDECIPIPPNRGKLKTYPWARVRFQHSIDAEKIFGNQPLQGSKMVEVRPTIPQYIPVAVRGILRIRPSKRYPNMTEHIIDSTKIEFTAANLSLGHWFPSTIETNDDAYCAFQSYYDDDETYVDDRETSNISKNLELTSNQWIEEESTNLKPSVCFNLQKRAVELSFPTITCDMSQDPFEMLLVFLDEYTSSNDKLSFRFKDLVGSIDLCIDDDNENNINEPSSYSLYFSLKYPPKLWKETMNSFHWTEIKERKTFINGINKNTLGRCFGYKISLDETAVTRFLINEEAMERLRNFGLLKHGKFAMDDAEPAVTIPLTTTATNAKNRLEITPILTGDAKTDLLLCSLFDKGRCCLYHAYNDNVDGNTIFDLCRKTDRIITHNVLSKMCNMAARTRVPAHVFWQLSFIEEEEEEEDDDLKDQRNIVLDGKSLQPNATKDYTLPDYCIEIPRIMITPTRVAVTGFDIEMSNRVVRKFVMEEKFISESFCRVSICDENGDQLFSNDLTDAVIQRIKSTLLSGIILHKNKLQYEFLAYSSSQLKEGSVWMVCPQQGWNVESIRAWMGDFSQCKTASKYAARMGQCFSTTYQAHEAASSDVTSVNGAGFFSSLLSPTTFRSQNERTDTKLQQLSVFDNLEDILIINQSNRKEMCHSDGTGLIDNNVLQLIVEKLPFAPRHPKNVSIIQIRVGGAKGTLTGWNYDMLNKDQCMTRTLKHNTVYLRPSMVKFQSPYRHLEVIKVGAHVPYYLNRHVILLLSSHGVKIQTFLSMQREMLDALDSILTDRNKAAELLPRLGGADSDAISTCMHMLHSGLCPAEEPFLFSCAYSIRAHHLLYLRKKARIFVKKGAVLIGGLDETGLLPEGCIFVQVRRTSPTSPTEKNSADDFEPIVGPVMVTKHPALHPGDVRMLLAIDIPELHAHKNVLLFSKQGLDRPEADKMSGSDLDGDEFAVTWDDRLFLNDWNYCTKLDNSSWRSKSGTVITMDPHYGNSSIVKASQILQCSNHSPGSYEAPSPSSMNESYKTPNNIDGTFNEEQLIGYFLYHAQNANLGRIANSWLDYAALNGATCNECIALAGLHSIAVDFPKSGIPAKIPSDLTSIEERAHWREIKHKTTYHDEGVIGRMYDDVAKCNKALPYNHRALVGRNRGKNGQILCNAHNLWKHMQEDGIYKPRLPEWLGLYLSSSLSSSSSSSLFNGTNNTMDTSEEIMFFAKDQRKDYNDELMSLMNKYKVHSEGEILTGLVMKYHSLYKRRRFDVSQTIKKSCRELRKNFRQLFFLKVWALVMKDISTTTTTTAAKIKEANPSPHKGTLEEEEEEEEESIQDETEEEEDEEIGGELVARLIKICTKATPIAHNTNTSNAATSTVDADTTTTTASNNEDGTYYDFYDDPAVIQLVQDYSRKLAAAYYVVTYSPGESECERNLALFSFPWVIVADVIASGIYHHSYSMQTTIEQQKE